MGTALATRPAARRAPLSDEEADELFWKMLAEKPAGSTSEDVWQEWLRVTDGEATEPAAAGPTGSLTEIFEALQAKFDELAGQVQAQPLPVVPPPATIAGPAPTWDLRVTSHDAVGRMRRIDMVGSNGQQLALSVAERDMSDRIRKINLEAAGAPAWTVTVTSRDAGDGIRTIQLAPAKP